jgi:hypothetical protein
VNEVKTFKELSVYTEAFFYGHLEIKYSLKPVRAGWKSIYKNNYVVVYRRSQINSVVGYGPGMLLNMG